MIIVNVSLPKVKFDTVQFTWTDSKKVPFFKKNTYFIRYEGINIEKHQLDYFWYSFLSIMVPIYSFCEEDVLFKFPTPIPSNIAELWINYHNAKNIYIYPLKESSSSFKYTEGYMENKIGILFGGGKDSTYAFSILSEIYGKENIVLLSYVLPYMENTMDKHDKRRDAFILNPLKNKTNVKIQKVYSDFYSNLTKQSYKYSTHIAIYLGTLLPVLFKHNLNSITFSYEFLAYRTGLYGNSAINFNYRRSRPEYTKYVSSKTSEIINKNINIVNFNYYFSELCSFKVLAKRYPERLKNILMCEHITEMKKYCMNCTKCATYVFLSMYFDNKYLDIDLNNFFENGKYIKSVLNLTDGPNTPRNEYNNCLWTNEFSSNSHYESTCHLIASLDLDKYKNILSEKAFENLLKLKERFGNMLSPAFESFIEPAFECVSPPIPNEVRDIVTKYCPSVNKLPEYFYVRNEKATIDYNLICNIEDIFNIEKNNSIANQYVTYNKR